MVQFTDLPEEIIIMIIRQVDDFVSLQSLYNTCTHFRNIVCLRNVIQECNMSMNTMATALTLKSNIFRDISNHLLKLNMCGVPDLFKTKVLPAFKKLKCLKTLDISYTNLNILDLIDIHEICPTVKDVTVNFVFGPPGKVLLSQETIIQCQSVFEHFENIHFVGSLVMLFSNLVLNILKNNSVLKTLKLSAVEEVNVITTRMDPLSECTVPPFQHFAAYLINWKISNVYESLNNFPILSMIEFKNYEYFIICSLNTRCVSVYATPIFRKFFSDNFNITAECANSYSSNLTGNIAIMIWKKDTTKFDDCFFHKLYKHLKPCFCYFYESLETAVPWKYDWFYTKPTIPAELKKSESFFSVKRRRSAMSELLLNYDNVFKEKRKVELCLVFNSQIPAAVTLSENSGYLRKLTFLSLSGSCQYTAQFFNILFRCCDNLVTLSVQSPTISPCASPICRSIALSRSLKNIRLVDKCIDHNNVFSSFSQCHTLENIHLIDQRNWDHSQIADPSVLVEKCDNLYSVFINAPFAETAQVKLLQLFNKAKVRSEKHYMRVVINGACYNSVAFKYNYDPFVDVFRLYPIKPI